jgi:hypothetical protein
MSFTEYAQKTVKGSKLTVEAMSITTPSVDGFKLNMRCTLDNMGPIEATLEPMTLSFSTTSGNVFGDIMVPDLRISDGHTQFDISQQFVVLDFDALQEFGTDLLNEEIVSFCVTGKTRMYAHGERSAIEFEKVVELAGNGLAIAKLMIGMGGFQNIAISELDIPAEVVGGLKLRCTARFRNHSIVTIFLGSVMLEATHQGEIVARVTSADLTVVPGDNILQINGIILAEQLLKKPSLANQIFSDIMEGYPINYSIIGVGTSTTGQKIPWITSIIKKIAFELDIQGNRIDLLYGMMLDNLDLSLTTEGGTLSSDIRAKLRCNR